MCQVATCLTSASAQAEKAGMTWQPSTRTSSGEPLDQLARPLTVIDLGGCQLLTSTPPKAAPRRGDCRLRPPSANSPTNVLTPAPRLHGRREPVSPADRQSPLELLPPGLMAMQARSVQFDFKLLKRLPPAVAQ